MSKGKRSKAVVPAGAADPAAQIGGDLGEYVSRVVGKPVKVVKNVTLPVLRQNDGVPIAVQFDSAIRLSKPIDGDKTGRTPPHVAEVIELQTGELCTLICNAAMKSAIERMYPDEKYIGKQFAMVSKKRPHKGERTIREYAIREIEIG